MNRKYIKNRSPENRKVGGIEGACVQLCWKWGISYCWSIALDCYQIFFCQKLLINASRVRTFRGHATKIRPHMILVCHKTMNIYWHWCTSCLIFTNIKARFYIYSVKKDMREKLGIGSWNTWDRVVVLHGPCCSHINVLAKKQATAAPLTAERHSRMRRKWK